MICLFGSAFFAASETALTSASLSAWERLQKEKPSIAPAYALWSGEPSLVLATMLFGNMITSLGASVLSTALVRPVAELRHWPTFLYLLVSSFLAGTTILTFGEILPKLYA